MMRRALLVACATLFLATDSFAQSTRGAPKPRPRASADSLSTRVLAQAGAERGMRILVSIEERWLWLLRGTDTLMSVPAAVGMNKDFEFEGRKFTFATPRGRRKVLAKQASPVWNVPEWHYLEKAAKAKLIVVKLKPEQKYLLEDGTFIDVRGDQVGRLNKAGYWWPFSQNYDIEFYGKIFVPPENTIQRKVTNALGPYKLDTGDGYLIHGTHDYNENSIGDAVSHGCVRLTNDDLRVLYAQVPQGTPVFIF
jgi:hypothetical protein